MRKKKSINPNTAPNGSSRSLSGNPADDEGPVDRTMKEDIPFIDRSDRTPTKARNDDSK